jgi:hypothetical protein
MDSNCFKGSMSKEDIKFFKISDLSIKFILHMTRRGTANKIKAKNLNRQKVQD